MSMKKIVCIIIPFLFLQFGDINKEGSIFVDCENILYVGGSGPNNYSKIQDAINDAMDGDTIFVYDDSSPYYENIVINKSICLIGENSYTTVIDGMRKNCTICIFADDVSIKGFTIRNSSENGSGIKITPYNCNISNNIIMHNHVGIYLDVWSANNIIFKNNLSCNYEGLLLFGSDRNFIAYNTVMKAERGISLQWWSSDNIFTENNIMHTTIGILLHDYSAYNTVVQNSIKSDYYGIWLASAEWNKIGNNIISNNTHGIFMSYAHKNIIVDNIISHNMYGLYSYCNNNTIYHNNFIENQIQAIDKGNNFWDNGYPSGCNYWNNFDEPSEGAYDNNSDGIVDSPYYIIGKNNTDRYPLVYPWKSIEIEIHGGFGIKIVIRNVGDIDLLNAKYLAEMEALFILKKGTTEKTFSLPIGREIAFNISTFGFGFGKITIKVGIISKTADFFLLGPFFHISSWQQSH